MDSFMTPETKQKQRIIWEKHHKLRCGKYSARYIHVISKIAKDDRLSKRFWAKSEHCYLNPTLLI